MKNAHFKTCNNLIFANTHRWYKIHTTRRLTRRHCAHGTKASRWCGLLVSTEKLRSWWMKSREPHGQSRTSRDHSQHGHASLGFTAKRETTLHFPHFKVIDTVTQHFKEWRQLWIHVKHCISPAETRRKKLKQPKPKAQQACWGPGCSWKCSQAWPLKSTVRCSAQTPTLWILENGTVSSSRYSEHNWRKSKAGRKKHGPQWMCRKDTGLRPWASVLAPHRVLLCPPLPPSSRAMANSALQALGTFSFTLHC